MTAYTWTILLLEEAPYVILAGSLVLVVLIYKLWRME